MVSYLNRIDVSLIWLFAYILTLRIICNFNTFYNFYSKLYYIDLVSTKERAYGAVVLAAVVVVATF
jgi:hypothetical protein